MEFTKAICKPFVVEVLRVTTENIADIAPFVGELMFKEEDNSPFIQVDKKLVPNVYRVYPGFYMTRLGGKTRFYSKRIFSKQFTDWSEEAEGLVDILRKDAKTNHRPSNTPTEPLEELPQPEVVNG